ncbi:MAG TPA: DUF881 domain-containing protein [Actinomycetes bacterium]|nr:DUF881 domain-containing protein [Actinomycetes bacterium]
MTRPDEPAGPAGAPGAAEPGEPVKGRARLRSALHPRTTRAQVVAALLCGVLGFAAAVQVRSTQDAGLSGLRQTDLVRILDDVSERSARLQSEARELQETRDRVTGDDEQAALQEARDRTRVLGILAGTLPARGPGIQLTITDPQGQAGADVLIDTLQELRDAGAEAVEISSVDGPAVRVVASTSFVEAGEPGSGAGVEVDGTVLRAPYRFLVIGEPGTLATALEIPGGVLEVLDQRGAQGVVTQEQSVEITSLRVAPSPRYARPAGAAGDADNG